MIILVSGFEPFQSSQVNPSQEVCKILDRQVRSGVPIQTVTLPVRHRAGPSTLIEAIQQIQPEIVLCLGESTGVDSLRVERVAINLINDRIPDNGGESIRDARIVPGGPDAYFTHFPVDRLVEKIQLAGVPAEESLSAGTFLCNEVFYSVLHEVSIRNSSCRVGFIHLPALPMQIAERKLTCPSMELETSCTGVLAAIDALLEWTREPEFIRR